MPQSSTRRDLIRAGAALALGGAAGLGWGCDAGRPQRGSSGRSAAAGSGSATSGGSASGGPATGSGSARATATGAAPADSPGAASIRDFRIRETGSSLPELVIAEGESDAAALVRKALQAMGGMKRFVQPGDVVCVKPNIGFERRAEHAANTSPEVVGAVVQAVLEAGAKKVIVTDHCAGDPATCFSRSGIGPKAEELGAEILLPADEHFKEAHFGGRALALWPLYQPVFAVDKVINVPIAKEHGSIRFSGGIKNWFGVLGDQRSELHPKIQQTIADVARYIRPTLTVIDAVRVLMRNGPFGGNLADTEQKNTVIATIDQVAGDAFACGLIGQKPADVPYLALAAEAGAGTLDWTRLRHQRV